MTTQSITLDLDTFGMEDLSEGLTPVSVVVRFSEETLTAIDQFAALINSDERIKSLSVDLSDNGFEASFINDAGDDTGLDGVLDLEISLNASSKGSCLQLVLSGCEAEVEDDDGNACFATGEFFTSIPVMAMREQLTAS